MRYAAVALPVVLSGCVLYESVERIPGVSPSSPERVVSLARAGVPAHELASDIRANGVIRRPSADDIVSMKEAGVSDRLIQLMLEAPVTVPRPETVIRRTTYDTCPAEGLFWLGVGAVAGWSAYRHHHGGYHGHYYGCGH